MVSAPAERIPGMTDEHEKRKKNQISKEEEIEKLNRQIKILAEERKILRESRMPQKGKPRLLVIFKLFHLERTYGMRLHKRGSRREIGRES